MINNNYGFLHMVIFKYKQLIIFGLVSIIKVKQLLWLNLMKSTLSRALEIITNKVNTNKQSTIIRFIF